MCGRFVSASPPDELAKYFGAEPPTGEPLAANYNVAPTTEVYAVVEEHGGAPEEQDLATDGTPTDGTPTDDTLHRRLERFRWGLVPPWAEDLRTGARMINARLETVATRNAFRSAFRRRRCIVPADGFYEWTAAPGRKQRQPWYIHRPDGEPYAFAGLWELWRPKGDDGPWVRTCTVLTAAANPVMARIHDRMPVVLPPEAWERWPDPDLPDPAELLHLLSPTPASLVAFHAVSTDVNRVANRGPHLLDEVPGVALDGPPS